MSVYLFNNKLQAKQALSPLVKIARQLKIALKKTNSKNGKTMRI